MEGRSRSKGSSATDGAKKVVSMELDVSNQVSIDNLLDKVERTSGRLDILVNNAVILIDRGDVVASNADLDTVMTSSLETNLIGAITKPLIPLMKKNGYGRIVNVSSGAGEFEYMATSGGYWPGDSVSKTQSKFFDSHACIRTEGDQYSCQCRLPWMGAN